MSRLGTTNWRRLRVSCSFCGKRDDEVQAMVFGAGVRICDECVDLAAEIIRNRTTQESEVHPPFIRERALPDQAAGWFTPTGAGDEDRDDIDFLPEPLPDVDDETADASRKLR